MYTLIYRQNLYCESYTNLRDAWERVQVQCMRDAPTHIVEINEDSDARVMDLSEFVRHARDAGY